MKILYAIFAMALITACGGKKSTESSEGSVLEGVQDIVSNAEDIAERQAALKDMQPLGEQDFLSWAPNTFMSLPKKESTEKYLPMDKYGYSGYNTYYKGEDKSIQLEVFDGAGSSIYSRYAGMLSTDAMSQERENYYEKNVERDGTMVYEWYDSKRNDCAMMFIVSDRFVVNITGSGFPPDQIWENIGEFNLDKLN